MRLLLAAAAVTVAGLVPAAPAAAAYPYPPCRTVSGNNVTAGAIEAWYYQECWEYQVPLTVHIEVGSAGTWTPVATGRGWITYYCPGPVVNVYRTTREPAFSAACGA